MKKTVLVINKLGTLRRLTVQALRSQGYTDIIEVAELDEAIGKLESLEDVLIILELSLTEWKAVELEFIKYLKKFQKLKNIAVIVTTQAAEPELTMELLQLGIKEYIIRPYEIELYSIKLKTALERVEQNPSFWTTLIGA